MIRLARRERASVLPPTLLLLLLVAACGVDAPVVSGAPSVAGDLATQIVEDVRFSGPAAVIHDPIADLYLVSNIEGDPLERDGKAFISRVSPSGRVEDVRWIDGATPGVILHAPKGMALLGDSLLVADIDCVRSFHRVTGEPGGSTCPPAAVSLNDLAFGADGTLHVTDGVFGEDAPPFEGGRVLAIGRGGAIEQTGGEQLGGPSGIATGPNGTFFTTFAGTVYQLRPGKAFPVFRSPGARLGGIAFTRDASFAVVDVTDSSVIYVEVDRASGKGLPWTLIRDMGSPGGVAYDAKRHRFLLTELDRSRLFFIDLPD